jgi:hypothetical protein
MAKNSITDYSKTAASNTDIQSVDIDEGCLPSGINNAIRELMADLAAMNDGTVSLTSPAFTSVDINGGTIDGVTIGGASAGAGTFTTLTASGDLTVDTNTLYVDSTNNRVGIGTSSPTSDLTFGGAGPTISTDTSDGSDTSRLSIGGGGIATNTGRGSLVQYHGNEHGSAAGVMKHFMGNASGSYISWHLGSGSEAMRIDSSGRVGIGTSSPLARLDVESGTGNAGFNYGTLSSPDRGNLWYDTDGTGWRFNIGKVQSGSFTSQITIQDNGSVGIGTSSPDKALTISASDSQVRLYDADGTNQFASFQSDSGTTKITSRNNTSHGTIAFQRYNGTTVAESMRIDSSGNVGIGDTAPVTPLTIATTNKLGSTFTGTTNGEGLTVTQTNYTSGNYISLVEAAYDDSGDANPNVRIGAMFDGNGSNLAFGTSNSYGSGITNTAMFINSSGNVGIGTSSPDPGVFGLHIHNPSSNFSSLKLSNGATGSTSGDGTSLQLDASGNVRLRNFENTYMTFETNNSERMRIDSSGNVGIGTNSPLGKLEVKAAGFVASHISSDSTSETQLRFNTNTAARVSNQANTALIFDTNATERMRIDSSGNLLVRTTTSPSGIGVKLSNGGSVGDGRSGVYFGLNGVYPSVDLALSDNDRDLGAAIYRWDDVYATNGTIQTSDQNEKQDIEALSEAEQRVAVAAKGLLRKFRWIDSVEEKGDDARIHFGIIAQDLQAAFEAEGLDAGRYAMFINSTWTDEETGEERSRMGVRYNQLLAFIIAAI